MANKRTLKRVINGICDELSVNLVASSLYGGNVHEEDMDAVFYSILSMRHNFISRVSHPEPGIPAKTYYRDLCEKFGSQVSEIVDQINSI